MQRKKKTKKPRTFSIGIGIEAGSEIEFRWSQEAQILAYRVRKEGKPVKPVNTIISYGYDRPNKNPKILTSSSSPLTPPFINFNEALSKFAFVVAVDTSYPKDEDLKEGEDRICAACLTFGKLQEAADALVGNFLTAYGLELWNPRCNDSSECNPELFAWRKAIQLIQGSTSCRDEECYALIVDSFISRLPAYDLHTLTLVDNFYLPKNFELFYASDKGETLQSCFSFIYQQRRISNN